jgi:RNA polymerase sigma factor (TIGR02999 family)
MVTRLLNQWQQGDTSAFDELSSVIYGELHRIAGAYLSRFPSETLQPTALVNEAYLRLTGQNDTYTGRRHFYALAAKIMRQVLVDRARARNAAKRGSGSEAEPLDDVHAGQDAHIDQFLILDQSLTQLSREQPRLAQIIELRYFGGLTGVEVGEVLEIPAWQVSREQRLAEAWLKRALSGG